MILATILRTLIRLNRLFLRINNLQLLNSSSPQFFSHNLSQRTNTRLINISDFKPCRIQLISCSHCRHNWNTKLISLHNKLNLSRNSINSINNIINTIIKYFHLRIRHKKLFENFNIRIRINLQNPIPHQLSLILSNSLSSSMNLSI